MNVHNEIAIESNRNLPNRADKFADARDGKCSYTVAFHVRSCRASLPAPSMAGLSGGFSGKVPTQRDHPHRLARDSTHPNPFSCKRRTRRGTPGRVTRSSRRPPYVKIFDSCSMHLVHRLVGDPRGRRAGSRHPHLGWKQRARCSATHDIANCRLARLLGTSQRSFSRTSQKAVANVSWRGHT